jgi:hypothetical protein
MFLMARSNISSFIYFRQHRKQSSLEQHRYLHPWKWMKHPKYK